MATRIAHHAKTFTPGASSLSKLFKGALQAAAVGKQRRALAKMDATQLADLGISRQQANAEAKRHIWDVPAHWHQ